MKKLLLLLLCWFGAVGPCGAADGVGVFQNGLRAFQENGPDALLNSWFPSRDETERIARVRDRLGVMARQLGAVMDTEVFTPHRLGSRVQRLYGVIYFEKRPLWVRADFYAIGGNSGFISLEFSLVPDEILPVARLSPP